MICCELKMSAALLSRFVDNIRINGCINLDIEENPKTCRSLFKSLLDCAKAEHCIELVKSLELPTNYCIDDEDEIFSFIYILKNLKFCKLSGERRGGDGKVPHGDLETLPKNFADLQSLTYLDLSFNSIVSIPDCIWCLYHLKILKLDFNRIQTISPAISSLTFLEELYLRNNQLSLVSEEISSLPNLKILNFTSNELLNLPNVLHLITSLCELDVSNNHIEELPEKLFTSVSLKSFRAGHNCVESLPPSVKFSSNIQTIDLRYNFLMNVDDSIKEDKRLLLQGNIPNPNKLHILHCVEEDDYDVPRYILKSNISNLKTYCGGCYELPSGVQILIPNNFACDFEEIYCNVVSYEDANFTLNPTDQLLSVVLHLTPNGLCFDKAIRITMPYTFSGFDSQKREMTVRVASVGKENKYEDLRSVITKQQDVASDSPGEITAHTTHFSMFAVVSRLVQNAVVVNKDASKTVVSSADPFTKLHFPEDCVSDNTNVILEVLTVNPAAVRIVTGAEECYASNVLHVYVKPVTVFKLPITVHIALPDPLKGKTFDKKELRLMKSQFVSEEWYDITDDVVLTFTSIDVSFQTHSFSRFWCVWSSVRGFARKVYRRIITHNVQFLAMQQRMLPSRIIAQCVRADLVDKRMAQLVETGYRADDCCTVVQELLEGEQFKVKVIGDLQIKGYNDATKEHLEKTTLPTFYSQFPPDKTGFCKFFVEPTSESSSDNVSGLVAFYRIYKPLSEDSLRTPVIPECVLPSTSTKRSHDDNINRSRHESDDGLGETQHYPTDAELVPLGDVPITLKNDNLPLKLPEDKEYLLCFGELGTGMFKESNLRYIASHIGLEWQEIGHYLDIRTDDMERIMLDYRKSSDQIFQMLKRWAQIHMHEDNCVQQFTDALKEAGRSDLAHKVMEIFEEGFENFRSTIKRRKEITTPQDF